MITSGKQIKNEITNICLAVFSICINWQELAYIKYYISLLKVYNNGLGTDSSYSDYQG